MEQKPNQTVQQQKQLIFIAMQCQWNTNFPQNIHRQFTYRIINWMTNVLA